MGTAEPGQSARDGGRRERELERSLRGREGGREGGVPEAASLGLPRESWGSERAFRQAGRGRALALPNSGPPCTETLLKPSESYSLQWEFLIY